MKFNKFFSFFTFLMLGAMTNVVGLTRCAYIDKDHNIYYFSGTVPDTGIITWRKIDAKVTDNPISLDGKVKDISISPNGKMLCIDTDGKVYYSEGVDEGNDAHWIALTNINANAVAVAGDNFAYIGKDTNIYYHSGIPDASTVWGNPIFEKAKAIAISPDGKMLCVGTDPDGIVYYSAEIKGNKTNWITLKRTIAYAVAVAGDHFAHIGTDNNIYYHTGDLNPETVWEQPIFEKAKAIAISPDGKMLCINFDGNVYYSAKDAKWGEKPLESIKAIAVAITFQTEAEAKIIAEEKQKEEAKKLKEQEEEENRKKAEAEKEKKKAEKEKKKAEKEKKKAEKEKRFAEETRKAEEEKKEEIAQLEYMQERAGEEGSGNVGKQTSPKPEERAQKPVEEPKIIIEELSEEDKEIAKEEEKKLVAEEAKEKKAAEEKKEKEAKAAEEKKRIEEETKKKEEE
jgi:WD40 repeat protein